MEISVLQIQQEFTNAQLMTKLVSSVLLVKLDTILILQVTVQLLLVWSVNVLFIPMLLHVPNVLKVQALLIIYQVMELLVLQVLLPIVFNGQLLVINVLNALLVIILVLISKLVLKLLIELLDVKFRLLSLFVDNVFLDGL